MLLRGYESLFSTTPVQASLSQTSQKKRRNLKSDRMSRPHGQLILESEVVFTSTSAVLTLVDEFRQYDEQIVQIIDMINNEVECSENLANGNDNT